jgi:hypothetical protein
MMRPAAVLLVLIGVVGSPLWAAKEDAAPGWLLDAAATVSGPQDPKARALVLLDEGATVVTGAGTKKRRLRYAVRILNDEGRSLAIAAVPYLQGGGEVKSLQAWLITPAGTTKAYGKRDVVDLAQLRDVYSDYRIKQIDVRAAAVPGAVFGWESEEEDRSIFLQETWSFQGIDPVVVSRYRLELPAGWLAESRVFNHGGVVAGHQGTTWTWEVRNLPRIELEEAGLGHSALAPRLAIDYRPADPTQADAPAFGSWPEVARWQSGLHEARLDINAELQGQVARLVAGIGDRWAQIEALARFVQGIRYVSIQVGIARGGGYQPHPATEVLSKGYGDCKDKANLLRAMLRELGVASHSVAIYAGDPRRVVESWPSPHQFNHAIVAIEVGAEVERPAVGTYEGMGRLLFFDPTDDVTPIGWLPAHEYSTLVLVAKDEGGALVRTPAARASDHHLERSVEVRLGADGLLQGVVEERAGGIPAASARALWEALEPKEYRDRLQRWLGQQAPRASVRDLTAGEAGPGFERRIAFEAPQYGQRVGGALWLVKLAFLGGSSVYDLTSSSRTQPLFLQAESQAVRVALVLPDGWQVDELPTAIERTEPWGELVAHWRAEGGVVRFEQRVRIDPAEVPAGDYPRVREFLRLAESAADQAVVLARP